MIYKQWWKEQNTLKKYNNNFRGGGRSRDDRTDKPFAQGITVTVRNGDFTGAMRKFKRKVSDSGILQELRERTYYEKPSEKRKKAKAAGIARWKKKQAKDADTNGY